MALIAVLAGTASAQTTTTQFAAGITNPEPGVILSGTAINPLTGKPFRHLWYGDFAQGLCRLDPDVDSPAPAGGRVINTGTCLHFVFGQQLKAGELTLDPRPSTVVPGSLDLYVVNIQAGTEAIYRMHFLPNSDSGHGLLDLVHQEVLGGSQSGKQIVGGCGVPGNVPNSTALGPDGNLYVGFKRNGNIVRIVAPGTEPLPCSNVQVMGTTGDQRKDFGLGFIGHDLYGGDGFSPWVIPNADQCFTAANGFATCHGGSILAGIVPAPTGARTNQLYPALNGTNVYFSNANTVTKLQVLPAQQVSLNYAVGFQFISGMIIDPVPANPGLETLYVGDDPSGGFNVGLGHWWTVTNAPPVLAAPGAPTNVVAVAGNAQATVSFNPVLNGQPVTSFTIHTLTAAGAATAVPDVVVAPTGGTTQTATVTGLTNGVPVEFTVTATNAAGSNTSLPSNVVTPAAPTVPGAPTGVVAIAGSASATVAWTAPASNGGSPITSYTVTALVGGVASGLPQTVAAPATGLTFTGLTNGTSYTFTVHATNAVGSGPESLPSNAVIPSAAIGADMAVTMTGPASVIAGSNATYTMTVTNNGPGVAPQVVLTDSFPPTGVAFVSDTTSQGACLRVGASVSCNLGSMAVGASATVTVTLTINQASTNSANVAAFDATGATLTDPTPGNNNASVTTALSAPATTPTDLQVVGSAQNGGPAVGSADTYTWQVKNNLGNVTADAVVFSDTLPPGLLFQSASTNIGTCTVPPVGTPGGTISCSTATLGGGQAMIVTIGVTVNQAGSISNTGSATMANTDTNPANNSFTVTISAK